jgi:mitochondrial chaperone BCS1
MGRVPARCIVLLEDLDAAFTRSASRDDESSGIPTGSKGTSDVDQDSGSHRHHSSFSRRRDFIPDYNTLSLSGLLNSLDGVSSASFAHLFNIKSFDLQRSLPQKVACCSRTSLGYVIESIITLILSSSTTNHLERLDPALTRPGRMDIWIEFKHASKWQAELLFKNFFSEIEDAPPQPTAEEIAAMEKEFAFLEAQQNAADGKVSFMPKDGTATSPTAGAEAMATAMEEKAKEEAQLPPPVLERPSPPPDPARLAVLARQFAAAIPEEEHSVASLQGCMSD